MEWVNAVKDLGALVVAAGLLFLGVFTGIKLFKKWMHHKMEMEKIRLQQESDKTLPHNDQIKTRLKITPEVKSVLKELLLQTHASRTYVFEFHNGTTNIAGLPFIYMSNTYEVLGQTATSQMLARQNMPFALYDSLITELINNEVVIINTKKKVPDFDDLIYKTLEKRGTKVLIGTKLLDEHKRVIGFLGIDYCGAANKATTNLDDPKYIKEMGKIVYREAQALSTLLYVKIAKDDEQIGGKNNAN